MRLGDEKGEGRLANFVWLVVILALFYTAWHAAPTYFDNYSFKDKMQEIARTPRSTNDDKLLDALMKEVRERELSNYIGPRNFKISTAESSRKIWCDYEREVEFLPGYKKIVQFHIEVDMPLVY